MWWIKAQKPIEEQKAIFLERLKRLRDGIEIIKSKSSELDLEGREKIGEIIVRGLKAELSFLFTRLTKNISEKIKLLEDWLAEVESDVLEFVETKLVGVSFNKKAQADYESAIFEVIDELMPEDVELWFLAKESEEVPLTEKDIIDSATFLGMTPDELKTEMEKADKKIEDVISDISIEYEIPASEVKDKLYEAIEKERGERPIPKPKKEEVKIITVSEHFKDLTLLDAEKLLEILEWLELTIEKKVYHEDPSIFSCLADLERFFYELEFPEDFEPKRDFSIRYELIKPLESEITKFRDLLHDYIDRLASDIRLTIERVGVKIISKILPIRS